jgi:hypothetical protein
MPLSPSNGLPRPFVEVVKGDLRNNFHGSDRACEANSACNDKADHEGIHRPRNAPTDRLQERPGVRFAPIEESHVRSPVEKG